MFSPRIARRLVGHHLPIVAVSALVVIIVLAATRDHARISFRWSMATAYVALVLLAATLILGPIAVLRRGRHPVSSDLRRDLGIWAAIFGIVHFLVGLQVHAAHRYEYWFRKVAGSALFLPRLDPFGLANYAGIVGVGIILMLLALSNDRSLRALGAKRWKGLQRWNYVLAGVVLAHTIAYEIIERRAPGFVAVSAIIVLVTGGFQWFAWQRHREERARK